MPEIYIHPNQTWDTSQKRIQTAWSKFTLSSFAKLWRSLLGGSWVTYIMSTVGFRLLGWWFDFSLFIRAWISYKLEDALLSQHLQV